MDFIWPWLYHHSLLALLFRRSSQLFYENLGFYFLINSFQNSHRKKINPQRQAWPRWCWIKRYKKFFGRIYILFSNQKECCIKYLLKLFSWKFDKNKLKHEKWGKYWQDMKALNEICFCSLFFRRETKMFF